VSKLPEEDSSPPEHKAAFEELLLDVSTRFINLPTESVDDAIEDIQRRICESLDLDLSALWQWADRDAHMMTITHLYTIPGGPVAPDDIDASRSFPWVLNRMLAGETLAFSTDDLPDDADVDRQSRRFFGVESSVDIPLQVGGQPMFGIITFDTLNRLREWSDAEVKRLKLVADIFANALVRKRAEEDLVRSRARLSLAAESAGAGIWELDCTTDVFWATDQARELFGYQRDESISMDRFKRSVHPDDWGRVEQAITTAFEKNSRLNLEYRIFRAPGDLKWVVSKGMPHYHDDGSPAKMLGVSLDVSERKQLEEQLREHLGEIEQLKRQIEQENYYLREDLKAVQGFAHIVGTSKKFKSVLISAKQVAATPATVLLTGETGTGKGIIANTIYQLSGRNTRPFVTVNCAALPDNLVESELFGREKGAFTGADQTQIGRFEIADKGTIFLDEVGEMSLEMQVKLLRVLQEGEFERLGSARTVSVDVRVIAATSRNLQDDVKIGRFREDLFYRLNVYPVELPPLRERKDDIPLLAQYFTEKYSHKIGKEIDRISKHALDFLVAYNWPGNIRELEHLIERSVIVSPGPSLVINEQFLPGLFPGDGDEGVVKNLAANERDHIRRVLAMTDWKIEGPGGAAIMLDIHPSTLRFRLKKLGIKRPS